MMLGCADYGRVIVGFYDDEKTGNDVTDCRCYYGNGMTQSGAPGWYWPPQETTPQLAGYLYDQRYIPPYEYRLGVSPPPSLSNGYDALPMATATALPVATAAGALYEALTPPDDDDTCATTTTAQELQQGRAATVNSSCRRNDDTERYIANGSVNNNSNNINTSAADGACSEMSRVGQGCFGVATPVIQMPAKSRYNNYNNNVVITIIIVV